MRKLFVSALAFLFLMAGAFAQDASVATSKKSAAERAERFTKRMNKELSLDAGQLERVKILNLERFQNLESARSQADKKQVREKVKEINETYFNGLKGVLNADQLARFEKLKEELKEKAFARKAGQ